MKPCGAERGREWRAGGSFEGQPVGLGAFAGLWVPKTRPVGAEKLVRRGDLGFRWRARRGSDAARIGAWPVSTVWSGS